MSAPDEPEWERWRELAPCPVCSFLNECLLAPIIRRPAVRLLRRASVALKTPLYIVTKCCAFSESRQHFGSADDAEAAWEKHRRAVPAESREASTLDALDAYEQSMKAAVKPLPPSPHPMPMQQAEPMRELVSASREPRQVRLPYSDA